MAENYYKITKEDADILGRFEYAPNHLFDPYCSEQKDGTYLVSEKMYQILKENQKIVDLNIKDKSKVTDETKDTKEIIIDDKGGKDEIIKGK